MNNERRAKVEPLYTALDPEEYNLLPFPPPEDDGDGDGSDADLATIIEYGFDPVCTGWGAPPQIGERQLEFAIKLGRALERAGITDDQI